MKARTVRRHTFIVTLMLLLAGAIPAHAELIYGLTQANQLVSFDSATPGTMSAPIAITGTTGSLQGIDFRPLTGQLYGLSFDGATLTAQVYTIDLNTGAATAQGASFGLPGTNLNSLVSIDFNPAADRLRIVSSNTGAAQTSTSYRWNPVTSSFVQQDGDILYVGGDVNEPTNNPAIHAVAYDNNVAGAPGGTTMYVYDFDIDVLGNVGSFGGAPNSPNTGQLNTIGNSLDTLDGNIGFDISGATGIGYITASTNEFAFNRLYTVNLATGALTLVGNNAVDLQDLSVAPIPEPSTSALLGVAGALAVLALRRRVRLAA